MPYHVRITQKSHREHDEVKLDLDRDQLEARFLTTYLEGRPVVIGGKTIPTEDIERIRINFTEEKSEELLPIVRREEQEKRSSNSFVVLGGPTDEWLIADKGKDVTDDIITGPPGSGLNARSEKPAPSIQDSRENVMAEQRNSSNPDQRTVFVVHGRNEKLRIDLFAFLRTIGLNPIEFSEAVKLTGKAAPYIGEILDAAFKNAQAVVVLMSPDDEARLRKDFQKGDDPEYEKDLRPQPRQNVLFEAGLAFGYKPDRTILARVGNLRPFSDMYGRHEVRLANDPVKRQELANKLKNAGCAVRTDGTDWLKIGDFGIQSYSTFPPPVTRKISMQDAEKVALEFIKREKPQATDITISSKNLDKSDWHIRGSYEDPALKNRFYPQSMHFEIVINGGTGEVVSSDFRIGFSK